jgi:hypothetical protein
MAKYTVIIKSEHDLSDPWTDSRAPNFSWRFNERELGECVQVGEGQWEATYESMELSSPKTYTYLDMVNGGEVTYTLAVGEYGVKP